MLMERIRKDYGQMTAVERRIAAVILEDPVGVTNSTLAHLAAQEIGRASCRERVWLKV